jgi:chain length determinant protein (polysaccharide antigen chain regulator)
LRREFFDRGNLVSHYVKEETDTKVNIDRIFDKKFDESLQVQVDTQDPLFVTVSLAYSDPELVAQWLNRFVDFVNERTVHQLLSDVESAIQTEITEVRYQLISKLKSAEQRRRDRVISLQEALSVAKALGLTEAGSFPMAADKNPAGVAVNTAQAPLYMRGTKALEKEITVLESRKSDEPFIPGLRDLQERLSFLEDIFLDPDTLSAVRVDSAAKTPYRAERPRKLLLIFIAATLGFMIGIFLVFIAEFRSKLYDEHEKPSA